MLSVLNIQKKRSYIDDYGPQQIQEETLNEFCLLLSVVFGPFNKRAKIKLVADAHIHIATTNNRSTYLFVLLNFTQHQLRYQIQITMQHKWKSFFCTIKFNNSMHAISYKNILFQIFGNLHPKMRSVVLLSIFVPELHTFVFVLV